MRWNDLAEALTLSEHKAHISHQSQVQRPAENMAGALDFLVKITTPPSLE